jgi:8-oxo-dGTP pyrophosphatase MutT (NUDIX family)
VNRSPTPSLEESAGGVVVRFFEGRPHILLIRDPYRKWGLPKGHLEPGESPAQAAVREVTEETGLEAVVVGAEIGRIDWTFRVGRRRIHKYCRFFLMTSSEGDPRPLEAEGISEVRWFPAEEAERTVTYDNARAMIRRALERLSAPGDEGSA